MPATTVSIADTWTLIAGVTTKDTLVTNSSTPIRICVGSTSGVSFDQGTPVSAGEKVIFPSGISVYGIAASGVTGRVWVTDFGV